jgi:CHAT domain-containing protein
MTGIGSSSFLKKRAEKLLHIRARPLAERRQPDSQKFFASFFQKRGAFFLLFAIASCASPPPSAYVSSKTKAHAASVPVGKNAAGETCTQDGHPGDAETAVYCGTWQQPSARVVLDSHPGADLRTIAATSSWRDGLDRRFDCNAPAAGTILGRDPAMVLSCTTRQGGWPEVAVAAEAGGRIWLADGVRPALPAIERSIGILSGEVAPSAAATQEVSAGLTAQRLAAQAFSSSDIGNYNDDLFAATQANLSGNYADAEALYRAMVTLQEHILGRNSPALATTLAAQALQLSNQGQYAEADQVFDRADKLARAPNQSDRAAVPLVEHYRALHLRNEGHAEEALAMLSSAEAGYAALLPPAMLSGGASAGGRASLEQGLENQDLFSDPTATRALLGVIETRRARAVTLRQLGRTAESAQAAMSAENLASARGMTSPKLRARLLRTSAVIAQQQGREAQALSGFSRSAAEYATALPGTRTYAETGLLFAAELAKAGRTPEALAACRTSAAVLRDAKSGTTGALLQPCLTTLFDDSTKNPAQAQDALAEMFSMAQLAQTSITSQQIAQASARLMENARDPRVGELIRAKTDESARLSELYSERDDARTAAHPDTTLEADLTKQINDLVAKQAATEQALQAASPNYNQIVQKVVSAHDVFSALHPGEAFAAVMLDDDFGWTFVLRDGRVTAAPVQGGSKAVADLVTRVRKSMDAETEPPPPFDIDADRALYDKVLGSVAPALQGATMLSVAPTGPMLALPFGVLLSGPAQQDDLAHAPWLVRQFVVEHVPSPANFTILRSIANNSQASSPWFGFGDFHPVTLAQAERTYPPSACGDSAKLLAELPPLPGAQIELSAVQRLTGASPQDELLGAAFTAANVEKTNLKPYRVLHFATHALLPTDLHCQTEPALITSPPPGAHDASGALLTASDVAAMHLDANAIILSACNTGGGGKLSGESLTGLARSFFYAGARALLVTHWSVNDRTTAYLVALTLVGATKDPADGLAGALASAQRRMLDDAKGDLAVQAHPFYWAALAIIGEGMGNKPTKVAGL